MQQFIFTQQVIAAGRMIISLIQNGELTSENRNVILDTELIVRASCGAVRGEGVLDG